MCCTPLTYFASLSPQLSSYNNNEVTCFSKSMNMQCSFFCSQRFYQHFHSKQLHQLHCFLASNHFVALRSFFSQSSFYNFFPYFDRVAYQLYLFIITAIFHFQLIFENCYQCIFCLLFCYLIPSSKALTVLVNRFTANYSKHFYISTGISSGPTAFSFLKYCIAVQTSFSVISFTFWIYSPPIPVFSFIFCSRIH